MKNHLDTFYNHSFGAADYARRYAEHIGHLLGNLDCNKIAEVIDVFTSARQTDNTIYFIGNGGSASTASHWANDLAIGTRLSQKPFRAMSLTDNASVLTALGNDDGYDAIFTRQLEVHMRPGDVVVAISASGNSPNVVRAVEFARSCNNPTVGFVGFDGGRLLQICDTSVHVETRKGEYGPVEDVHMVLDHLMSTYLYRWARDGQAAAHEDEPAEQLANVVTIR